MESLDGEIALESINVVLPMSEIYERVEFEAEGKSQ